MSDEQALKDVFSEQARALNSARLRLNVYLLNKEHTLEQRWQAFRMAHGYGILDAARQLRYEDVSILQRGIEQAYPMDWDQEMRVFQYQQIEWVFVVQAIRYSHPHNRLYRFLPYLDRIKEEILVHGYSGFIYQ